MKQYYSLITLLFLLLLTGCKKDPQEIYSEEKSGVVLICNEFYYDITLFNSEHLYFSGLDDDGNFINLTGSLADIKKFTFITDILTLWGHTSNMSTTRQRDVPIVSSTCPAPSTSSS